MISFKDSTNLVSDDSLQESRLLRKGVALLLARSAKKHGDTAENHFNTAQRSFSKKSDTLEEHMVNLLSGMNEMAEGLVNLRRQNGSITGISTTAVLLNERTNKQISLLLKKHK